MVIPTEELRPAATVLADLQWLAAEIEAGQSDVAQIERQRRAAGLLFTSLDVPATAPVLDQLLTEHQVDTDTILQWYSAGVERVADWEPRLVYVARAVDVLRPAVEQGLANLECSMRQQLLADITARRASIEQWIAGAGPWP
jgi:hypothetical protein